MLKHGSIKTSSFQTSDNQQHIFHFRFQEISPKSSFPEFEQFKNPIFQIFKPHIFKFANWCATRRQALRSLLLTSGPKRCESPAACGGPTHQ